MFSNSTADARPRRSSRRGLAAILATFILVASCSLAVAYGKGGGPDAAGPIKVGVLWPFYGAYSNYGPEGKAGIDLALKDAGMKVGDRKIQIIQGNENVLDPSQTLASAKRLVEQSGVHIILGPVFGSSQQAVASYFDRHNVMAFVPYGTTKELGGSGHFISWPGLDVAYSTPLGKYMKDTLGYKSIDTIGPDYVFGHNVLKGAVNTFKKAGGSILQQQWVPLGTTDLLPYATNLNKKADALVMWLVPQDEATFLKAYHNLKINKPIIFVYGMFDPTFQEAGSDVVGQYGLVAWSAALNNPANKKFVSDFRADNKGQYPNTSNAAAFVDTQLLLATIKAAHGNTSFEALKKAVTTVKLDTPYGPASIDNNFFGVSNRYLVKAEKSSDGRYVWVPVHTFTNIPNE